MLDIVGKIVGQRHYALPVALARDYQRFAQQIVHHVATVHLRNLTAPQTAFGGQPDHDPLSFGGLVQCTDDIPVRAWSRLGFGPLDFRQQIARVVITPSGRVQPGVEAVHRVTVALAAFRFPFLAGHPVHQIVGGDLKRRLRQVTRGLGHLATAATYCLVAETGRLQGFKPTIDILRP